MPLGILEDHKLEHVPGTTPLSDLGRLDLEYQGVDPSLLKHDPSGEIVLVPQPSDSPDDPYNWPRWKKELFTVAFAYGCGCVGAVGPLPTSALVTLSDQLHIPLQNLVTGMQGSCIIAIAVSSLLFNSLAVKTGKRPIYLATSLGLAASCFWAAETTSFASLAASRALMGFCMAPMEALIPASIADVWFLHERGFRVAVFNLAVVGGINLASPIAGPVIQYASFRVCFQAMGGAFVLQLLLTWLFMPETAYHRDNVILLDADDESLGGGEKKAVAAHKRHIEMVELGPTGAAAGESSSSTSTAAARRPTTTTTIKANNSTKKSSSSPLREILLPWNGYWDEASFAKTFLRPFVMLGSPVVLWATAQFTLCISWLVLISITISQIFSAPPYGFSISAIGLTNMSSFVATVLGTLAAGPLVDGVVRFMAKRNGGMFEPEFRLPIMSTYLVLTATGFVAFGQSLYAKDPWPIPVVVCMGMVNLGVQLGTTGAIAYVVDCHRQRTAECLGIMNFIKNIFAFGLTFYANDWIANQGVRNCFFSVGGITAAGALLSIPMYIYGKRARSFAARKVKSDW